MEMERRTTMAKRDTTRLDNFRRRIKESAAKKTDAINSAVDATADNKFEAVNKFMEAQFASMGAFEEEDRLRTSGKSEGDPEYDEAAKVMEAASAACDDALDDLIAAEFAYRAADKAWNKHHAALDETNAGGSVEKLQ
jgi:hypothetical protein